MGPRLKAAGYNVYVSAAPAVQGGFQMRITMKPVYGTMYMAMVTGAQTSYYSVTAVDSAGVESVHSAEVSGAAR